MNAQISPDELQNYTIPVNVQNMPLLKAATNTHPYLSKEEGGDMAFFMDNEALYSENSPILHTKNASSSAESFDDSLVGDEISIYVVHDGDTIPAIAKMFNVSANTIRWANDLDPKESIKKNQQLVILPISGVKYTVKKGDTIKSIASTYKGDKGEIIAFNGLESAGDLTVGDEIIIPNGEIGVSSTPAKAKSGTSGATPKNLASKGTNSGYLMRPVIGGKRTQGIHGHNGVDIAASKGTSILAAASGKVIVAKSGSWNGGYGNYVVISHSNGMQTLYGHLNSLNVKQGQQITKGDVIGGMGSSGDSSGVHLHFEVRGGSNPF